MSAESPFACFAWSLTTLPPDAASLEELAARILAFQVRYEVLAQPFEWKFTRADLARLLERLARGGMKYITELPCYST